MALRSRKRLPRQTATANPQPLADDAEFSDDPAVDEQPSSGITIEAVEPDDDEKPSLIDRIKDSMSGVPVEVDTPKKRGRPAGSRKQSVKPEEFSAGFVLPLVGMAMLMVPAEDRMSADEQAALALPSSRILLRHVKILGRIPEDVIDGYAIITVLISWRIRVSSEQRGKNGGSVSEPTQPGTGFPPPGVAPGNGHVRPTADDPAGAIGVLAWPDSNVGAAAGDSSGAGAGFPIYDT
jgi:hypothetical protein